jgi:hypothetical protein
MRDIIGQDRFVSKSLPRVFFGIPQNMHKNKGHVLYIKFGKYVVKKLQKTKRVGRTMCMDWEKRSNIKVARGGSACKTSCAHNVHA